MNTERQGMNIANTCGRHAECHVAYLVNHSVKCGMNWSVTPESHRVLVLNFICGGRSDGEC